MRKRLCNKKHELDQLLSSSPSLLAVILFGVFSYCVCFFFFYSLPPHSLWPHPHSVVLPLSHEDKDNIKRLPSRPI